MPVWLVVGLPIYLATSVGCSVIQVGSFLALKIIGYGIVQSAAPTFIGRWTAGAAPVGRAATGLAFIIWQMREGVCSSRGCLESDTKVVV